MKDFYARVTEVADVRSPFCLGIDPTDEVLRNWQLQSSGVGLATFCERLIDLCGEAVGIVKPQSAYFERFGDVGIKSLKMLVGAFKARGSIVLIDAKRGDIGSTNEAYASTYFGADSYFDCDAITVSPYLGFESLRPILDAGRDANCGVFVVVASSNVEARGLQSAVMADKRSIMDALVSNIADFNVRSSPAKPVGAVIGATRDDVGAETIHRLAGALVLCPGIGAQGASFEQVAKRLPGVRLIPTSARAILNAGADANNFRKILAQHCEQAARLWQKATRPSSTLGGNQ